MRIQAVIDDSLYEKILVNSKKTGLSISAITRLALLKFVKPTAKLSVIEQSLMDIKNGDVEELTVEKFNKELDELMK